MKKLKFLHCADIHLDAPFTSMGNSGKSSIRRQDIKEVFSKIICLAKEEKVDILLISGDLYEQSYSDKTTIHFINNKFREISDIRVLMVAGNHDPFIENSFYNTFQWHTNVTVLSSLKPYVVMDELDACIYGIGFNNFIEQKPMLIDFKRLDTSLFHILLLHGTVDLDVGDNCYNTVSSSELSALGMDYIALGHFHNRMDNIAKRGMIYNPGSPEPLGFDEDGEHGVYIGTIQKEGSLNDKTLDIRFINTYKRFYKNVEIDITGLVATEQICEKIADICKHDDKENMLLRAFLKGYYPREISINIEQIQAYLEQHHFFYIRIVNQSIPDFDFDEIMKENGLKGLYVRKLFHLIENEDDDGKKELLWNALYFGLQALEQGKIDIPKVI